MDVDYEYVELEPKIDLSQVRAWVNFYKGAINGPADGQLVMCHQGQTYYGRFTVPAHEGNRGKDRGERDRSSHWVELDLAGALQRSVNQALR